MQDLGRLQPEFVSPASLEWLLDTVANSGADADSRAVLQSLLLSHWHQRYFTPGTLAVAPLLGRRVIFEVRQCPCRRRHCTHVAPENRGMF